MSELRVELPEELLEELAERAADLVLARLAEQRPEASEYLSVREAAELLRSKPQRVYDLLSDGRLTRVKEGSRVLVSRAEIEAHLRPPLSRARNGSGVAR
jgi:excisionase family DNA binding protein